MACWDETTSERSTRYSSFGCALAPISLISRTCISGFEFTSPPFIAAIAFGVKFTAIASKRERVSEEILTERNGQEAVRSKP